MEVYSAKGSGMYPLAFIVISAILLNAYCCAAAAVLVKTNTTFRCDSRLHECLVEDDLDLELDILINPYVNRILGEPPKTGTGGTGDGNNPVCNDKGQPGSPSYQQCISALANNANNNCVPRGSYDCRGQR